MFIFVGHLFPMSKSKVVSPFESNVQLLLFLKSSRSFCRHRVLSIKPWPFPWPFRPNSLHSVGLKRRIYSTDDSPSILCTKAIIFDRWHGMVFDVSSITDFELNEAKMYLKHLKNLTNDKEKFEFTLSLLLIDI